MLSFSCSGLFSVAFINVETILPYLRKNFKYVNLFSTVNNKTNVVIFTSVEALIANRHVIKPKHIVIVSDTLFNLESIDSIVIDYKKDKVLKTLTPINYKPIKNYEIKKQDILMSIVDLNKGSDFQAAYIKAVSSIGEEGKTFINNVIIDYLSLKINLSQAIEKLTNKLQNAPELVASKLIYEFSNNIENYRVALTKSENTDPTIDTFLLEFFRKLK